MKKIPILIVGFCYAFVCRAQSITGVTGKKDTSYSTYSAYVSTLKTHPNIKIVPEFKSKLVSEKRNVSYCEIGDRKLMLDVFHPTNQNTATSAAILIIHGGGWRTGNRTQHYPLAQKLASLGYVCFTPEYRLSTEALFPAAIYDLKEAIRWIKNNAGSYNIDAAKVVALGFSAGGELSAFIGTTGDMPLFEGEVDTNTSSRVGAVVDIDGTLSFVHPDASE